MPEAVRTPAPDATGRRVLSTRVRPDGVTALTIYLVALTCVPARLVIGPLAGVGAPATVTAVLLAAWWAWHQVVRVEPGTGAQPVRLAYFVVAGAFLASYVAAMVRPIDSPEFSTAQIAMVGVVGWGGVLLVANDGIPDRDRLVALCRRLACAGGALATLGIAQFATRQQLVDRVPIPGLTANGALVALGTRAGFSRPEATALHPIEFGAVIAMILPVAVALAISDGGRSAVRRWYPVVALGVAIPVTISRSALISSVVALTVLGVAWTPTLRRYALAWAAALNAVVLVVEPGLFRSLLSLFTDIGGDTSAQSRTGSYAMAWDYIRMSPLIGRGFATFLPSYRILDNQLLGLLIEVGVLGLAAFLGLLFAGVTCGVRARRLTSDPLLGQLGQALAASVCAALSSLAFFDGLAFPMAGGTLFLVLGLGGAIWRVVRAEESRA